MTAIAWANPGTSGNWNVAANWNPAQIPTSSDTVTIGVAQSANYTVTIPNLYAASASTVTIMGGTGSHTSTLALAGGSLTTVGAITLSDSKSLITGFGAINAAGGFVVTGGTPSITASGGTLDITGSIPTTVSVSIDATTSSTLKIETTNSFGAFSITNVNQTLAIGPSANVTITAQQTVYGGKIVLAGGTITDSSGIRLGNFGSTAGAITGYGKVAANVTDQGSGANTITASGGTLEVTGAIGVSGTPLASLTIGSGASDKLLLDGTSYVTGVTFSGSTGTLEVNTAGALNLTNQLVVGANTVKLDGAAGTVQLTDAGGITLAGGSIIGTGTIALANTISGYGTVGISLLNGSGAGTITASGGTLELTGAVNQSASATLRSLAIGTAAGSDLKISGTAKSGAITLNNANQTLEVGSAGSLTITAAENAGAGHIKLGGGALTMSGASSTLTIGAGGLSGSGAVNLGANTLTGSGTITATGAIGSALTITTTGAVDGSAAGTFSFDIANGNTLAVAGVGNIVGALHAPSLTFEKTGQTAAETFQDTDATAGNVHLGTITGFSSYDGTYAHSDQIVLKSSTNAVGGDTLTNNGVNTVTIHFAGGGTQTFTFASTDVTKIHLTDNGGVDILTICFLAGTMIRTPDGEVPIETLKAGDLVLTTDGVAKPVSWLGKQTVVRVFADPLRSWPICVKAGALDENTPSRDLLVSPDHALLVEGALIQAGALVNGSSIVRVSEVPGVFVYYHVELDDHSLIFAENTPAETFVDNVDRMNFDNWAEHEALYPNGKTVEELPYPRAKAQRQVPVHVRVKLAERAQLIGATEAAVA